MGKILLALALIALVAASPTAPANAEASGNQSNWLAGGGG